MWFLDYRIRKCEESAAYYSGKVEVLTAVIAGKKRINSLELDDLVEFRARQYKYETRLKLLLEKKRLANIKERI